MFSSKPKYANTNLSGSLCIPGISSRLNANQLYKGWIAIHLADSFGGGWEMKSHEYVLAHYEDLFKGYMARDKGFDGNNKPGDHTDDAAMSQGSFFALLQGRGTVTIESLRDAWNRIYP